jgi:hypothetical protein
MYNFGRVMTALSPRIFGFDPRSAHVEFVVDEVTLGQVLLVRRFSPAVSLNSQLNNNRLVAEFKDETNSVSDK